MKTLIQKLNQWRRDNWFVSAGEHAAQLAHEHDVAFETAKYAVENKMREAEAKLVEAQTLFLDLAEIKLDVNGRSQVMDIRLVLDRRTLRLMDVEDAAHLLAIRTERIYKDALQKRLATKTQPV